jgi:hypothetical protein
MKERKGPLSSMLWKLMLGNDDECKLIRVSVREEGK